GGRVLAQDRETSVVWGMPGAVAQAGLCEEILPLRQIGPAIARIAGGEGK
ncbi:MAG: chemotaxis response regulator protein-glutamate methylesterase, partial [Parvibaculum sp.]|nr:chemotaxis response regulator protein-glutamate methylesterase [Parvibaculum sp.]